MPAVPRPDSPPAGPSLVADGLERLGLARPTVATAGRVLQLVTGDLEDFRHVAAILGGPDGDVLPLRHPLTPRAAWTTRGQVAA